MARAFRLSAMNWLVFPPAGSFACPPRPVVWLERLLRLSPALLTAACLVLALARLEFRSPAMSVILSACVFLIGGTAQGIAFALAPDRKVYGSTWTGRLTVRAPGERVNVSLDRVVAVQLCSRSTLRQELNVVLDCPPGMRVNVTAGKSGERMQEKARQLAEALGVPLIDSAASGEFDVAAGPGGA